MPEIAARAVDATKIYGSGQTAVTAIDQVSVDFEQGRYTAIMGPSGSGKSTLMHCMAGLDQLTTGKAYIGESDLSTLSDRELTKLRRDRIGFIFQAFNLVPTLTAAENITLPLDIAGNEPDGAWLETVVGHLALHDRLTHRPAELSGGQQQRVAAARALIARPALIFADEPSGNLDSNSSSELLELLRRAVKNYGQTIVMVTHDPIAASYADRVVFLQDGQVEDEMHEPTAERILDKIKSLEA